MDRPTPASPLPARSPGEPRQQRRRESEGDFPRRRSNAKLMIGLVTGVCLLIILVASLGAWAGIRFFRSRMGPVGMGGNVEYFAFWVQRRGAPEGYSPLFAPTLQGREFFVRMTRRNGRIEKVEYLVGWSQPTSIYTPEDFVFPYAPAFIDRGESWFTFSYTAQGRVHEQRAYDRFGKCLWTLRYLSADSAVYLDDSGQPEAPPWLGASHVKFVWSPQGWEAEIILQDAAGKTTPNVDGVAIIRQKHDLRGFPTEQSFHDVDGKPVVHRRRGYAGLRTDFNAEAAIESVTMLGTDGKPRKNYRGFATVRIENLPNMYTCSYFDERGLRTRSADGYASVTRRHTLTGQIEKENYFDVDGKPVIVPRGYCGWKARYDHQDRQVELTYLGPRDEPVWCNDGYATVRRTYDDSGRLLEEAYFGPQDAPCISGNGYARDVRAYDPNGHMNERWYYGVDGNPVLVDGHAGWRSRNAPDGRQTEMAYFGTDRKLCVQETGWARMTREYDDEGRLAAVAYFGSDDQPVRSKHGFARQTHKYNARDEIIETANFGPDGKPTLDASHVAVTRYVHDAKGRQVETAHFGLDGKPCLCDGGYSRLTEQYDEHGEEPQEINYFGIDGKPCLCKQGFSRETNQVSDKGQILETAWFDAAGKPVLVDGRARIRYVRDAKGLVLETHHLGLKGELIAQSDGVARWTARFDDEGRMTEQAFFDAQGKPARNSDGVSRKVMKYGPDFQIVEETYFGVDGKPAVCTNGYARWTATYNGFLVVDKTYYDTNGSVLPVRARVSLLVSDLGAQKTGLKVGDVLVTYDGQPVTNAAAFHANRTRHLLPTPTHKLVVERDGKQIALELRSASDVILEDFVPAKK